MVCALSLTACVSSRVDISNVPSPVIKTSETFPMSYDKTWSEVIEWVAGNNINLSLDKIRKDSGLITAGYDSNEGERFIECPRATNSSLSGFASQIVSEQTSKKRINILVSRVSKNRTQVTINFFGRFDAEVFNNWTGKRSHIVRDCHSTGLLEKKIFASLKKGTKAVYK